MSKKLAVFVEGYTEQDFTIRLLTELAGKHGITFEIKEQHKGILSFVELRNAPSLSAPTQSFFVLVANCRTDNQVKSQINDNYQSLVNAGYSSIIGLKDVYPFKHSEITDVENGLLVGLPIGSIPIHLHLAVMEIEAWFLEEITHYSRIDPALNQSKVIANGFDFNLLRAESLPHPSATLKGIYNSVGKGYSKTAAHRERTIDAISYDELYITTRHKSPSLNKFIASLENGLFSTV